MVAQKVQEAEAARLPAVYAKNRSDMQAIRSRYSAVQYDLAIGSAIGFDNAKWSGGTTSERKQNLIEYMKKVKVRIHQQDANGTSKTVWILHPRLQQI